MTVATRIHEPFEAGDAREALAVLATERLEAEITELAGQLAAGECRWLLLVAEFDRREAWRQWGCGSIVHWLSWQCGLDARSARERVRVARALLEHGAIREAFASGSLSYSKVRAITRIATAETEVGLVGMARHATAAQDDDHASARLRTTHDDGALFRGALDQLVERSVRQRPLADGETIAQRRADVLVETVARAAQHDSDTTSRSPADRHLVVVNVDASVLAHDDGETCELDGGPGIPADTARRIACDAEIVALVRGVDGTVTGIGHAERRPPRWLRRRLHARDGGCRYPGCPERRVVHAHHVQLWTRGGPTDLDNLVELCRYHHRLVHEGGWTMTFDGVHHVTFTGPDGRTVEDRARSGSAEPHDTLEAANTHRGIAIDPSTILPDYVDRLELDLALTALTPTDYISPYRGQRRRFRGTADCR